MKKTLLAAFLLVLLSASGFAETISAQLKSMKVEGNKAVLIYDIVNMDTQHYVEGFLLCKTPDDLIVSSSLGAAAGSGAQYVSSKFTIKPGPAQKSIELYVESTTPGRKYLECMIKYIPFRQEEIVEGNRTVVKRYYLLMNGEETEDVSDSDYRVLNLNEVIDFKAGSSAVPSNETTSQQEGVSFNWTYIIVLAAIVAVAAIAIARR